MADYIELEYIESTGTQYINTGIKTNISNLKVKLSFCALGNYSNNLILGSDDWFDGCYWLSIYQNNYRWYLGYTDGAIEPEAVSINVFIDIETSDNNIKIGNNTYTASVRTRTGTNKLCLLGNTNNEFNISGKLSYCKIYSGETLVRDFIPVKRLSDNKVCLYDKVSKTYFTNQGTGNFIAGPELLIANIQSIQTQLTKLNNLCENILGIPSYEIVPFATATDAQISALLDAHYAGTIDLSEIWNVGDTKVIHINALSAPVAGSNKAHVAQDMTFRIIGFKHDNLTTPINGITKAAVTIECKELLGNNGTGEYDRISGNSFGSSYENPLYWNNAYRRTWLNNNFVNALPSTFNTLLKTVVKRNLQGHSNTTSYVETNDKAFLLSYTEVFNSTYCYYRNGDASNDIEGTQYSYYNQNNTDASRIKYVNNNGSASSTAYYYWLRSPSSYNSSFWCLVYSNGSADGVGYDYAGGLAPALAI